MDLVVIISLITIVSVVIIGTFNNYEGSGLRYIQNLQQYNSQPYLQATFPKVLNGTWVFKQENIKERQCCSWSGSNGYSETCIQFHPILGNKIVINPNQTSSYGRNWCNCTSYTQSNDTQHGSWLWQPAPLIEPIQPWNAQLFCQILGERNVYMIGDSTMQQTQVALILAIRENNGGCDHQIIHWMLDMLTPVEVPELDIMVRMNNSTQAIIVLNTGSHMTNPHHVTWLTSYFEKYYELFHIYGRLPLFWKTNNPNCTTSELSLDSSHKLDTLAINSFTYNTAGVLDMTPLYLRPDAYDNDCTHFCLNINTGSPLELFSSNLLNAMLFPERGYW